MGRRIRRAGVGPDLGVPASARERRIAYGMASRLIGALHFQTVCAELVEAPFFLFDARKEEDRKSTRLNSVTNAHLVCRLLPEKKKPHSPHSNIYYTNTNLDSNK